MRLDLDVQFDTGSTAVTVRQGTAIDSQGREIVLTEDTPVELGGFAADASVYVTIAYAEEQTDPTDETGGQGKTRWTEKPLLESAATAPADPGQKLVLAQVGRTGTNIKGLDISARRTAGVVAGDLEACSLVLTNVGVVSAQWPRLHWGAANRVDVQGSLSVTGDITVAGRVDGRDVSADGTKLDQHVGRTDNPHATTATQVNALAVTGGTLGGNLQINGNLGVTGNVGIGIAAPTSALHVGTAKSVRYELGAGQKLSLGGAGTFEIDAPNVAGGRLIVADNGNVGLGVAPGFRLDVADRMRIRQGPSGSAGLWLFQTTPNADRAFVGMVNDTAVGFWGNNGAGWGLFMDTSNGNVTINGRLIAPNKQGFVVDQFVNNLGATLEEGDVVIIGENQPALYYGPNDKIPIPEVDIAQRSYDTRVCGIVNEAHATVSRYAYRESGAEVNPVAKSKRKTKAQASKVLDPAKAAQPREFTPAESEQLDRTQVEPGQIGGMVTLGAFAHCKVDADIAPIQIGDLLTTSPTKGHAQKVLDPSKAIWRHPGQGFRFVRQR